MAKNEFLFDLKTPETTWRGSGKHFFPNGKEASEAGMITSAEGPHGLYWCLDTIMHKVPEEYMDTWDMPHFHVRGYETFFVDSGWMYLYVDGRKCKVVPGDIIQLQPYQQHGMAFTTASKAGFITALYVVIVPLLSIFIRKRPSVQIWACVALALIGLYLHEDGGGGSVEATMQAALSYLTVMCFGFLPFAVTQAYNTTIRSHGETVAPMIATLIAVVVNLAGNYILIYGKLGAPALGVVGAATATVTSRFVELAFIAVWAHTHAARIPFITGAYRSLYVPRVLTLNCIRKGTPLLLNEALWSGGQAILTQCYSVRGLSVVSALNIAQTLGNVFNVAFIAMGSATAIIIGRKLGEWGESRTKELKNEAWRLMLFSCFLCMLSSTLMISVSFVFPKIYNTTNEIRALATGLIILMAAYMPIHSFNNASYFIIRSGGKTFITFLFDSCFCWAVSIPAAYFLAHYTRVPILPMYAAVISCELVKVIIGITLVNKGIWIKNITV